MVVLLKMVHLSIGPHALTEETWPIVIIVIFWLRLQVFLCVWCPKKFTCKNARERFPLVLCTLKKTLSHWPQSVHVWNPQMGPAVEEKQEIGKPDKTQSHGRTASLINTLLTVCMWALVEILSWIVSVLWWNNKGDCTSRQTSGRSLTITLIKSSRGSKVRLSEGAYGPQATSTFSGSATNEECGV